MDDIMIKNVGPMKIIALEGRGLPYSDTMPPAFEKLYGWMVEKGIEVPGQPPLGLALYHDDPTQTAPDRVRFEVAIPVAGDVEGEGEVVVKTLPDSKVAYLIHKGPYNDLEKSYMRIFEWLHSSKHRLAGSPRDLYMNDCMSLPPEELITEIQLPIRK